MLIRIKCRAKGEASIQRLDISKIMVIGRRDAMASYTVSK